MHRFVQRQLPLSRVLTDPEIRISYDFGGTLKWSLEKKSRLIEGLLLHAPLPIIYVGTDSELNLYGECDTATRMAVLSEYIPMGRFRLQQLEYLYELDNCAYKDLPKQYVRRLSELLVTIVEAKPV